jgi:hypothetical protein
MNMAGRDNELLHTHFQGEMIMPIPQVNDRIKEAPAVMLRAVFAGVGQLLLAADKVRTRAAGQVWPPDRAGPWGQGRSQSRWHSLDGSPNGTAVRPQTPANGHAGDRGTPADAVFTAAGPATGAEPASTAGEVASGAPPLPGYDQLSLPSLRARLRVLDADTLRSLLAYEKSHAHRDDVIAMFERRLAKITAG